jgi:hypothetical protein
MDLDAPALDRTVFATDLLLRLVSEASVAGCDAAIERSIDVVDAEVANLAAEVMRPDDDCLTSSVARFGPRAGGSALAFSTHPGVPAS